jgi:anti-sigma B factor antagonist
MEEHLQPFTCTSEYVCDHAAVVTVVGEVDLHTAAEVRRAIDEARRRGVTNYLVVDLLGVTFLDSTGLGVLIHGQRQTETPLKVISTRRQVNQTLRLTGLDQVFALYEDREQAMSALSDACAQESEPEATL